MARPKGSLNTYSKLIKEMVIEALENLGGVVYLQKQAYDNPVAFMGLLGKTMPLALSNDDDNSFKIEVTMNVKGKPGDTGGVLPATGAEKI